LDHNPWVPIGREPIHRSARASTNNAELTLALTRGIVKVWTRPGQQTLLRLIAEG